MLKKPTAYLLFTLIVVFISSIEIANAQETWAERDYSNYKPLNNVDLRFHDQQKNRELSYIHYHQYVDDVRVMNGTYSLIVDNQSGQIQKSYDRTLKLTYRKAFPSFEPLHTSMIDSLYRISSYANQEKVWYPKSDGLLPCIYFDFDLDEMSISGVFDLEKKEFIYLEPNISYFSVDSQMSTKIFSPDPLTQAQSYYGFPFRDYNDSSYTTLMSNASWQTFRCNYDFDSVGFVMENRWVKMVNFEAPNYTENFSFPDSFIVNRRDSRFEEFMVLAHLDHLQTWIKDLGVIALQNFQLNADAHAQFGQDNSSFRAYTGPQSDELAFGTGGVDDAEDADVITHEYCHGLLHATNGLVVSNFSQEAKALQEGLADFVATAYSYNVNPWGWNRMFSWDGHNEFWDGRDANTPNTYDPSESNIYLKGEVMNAALFKVARERNVDSVLKLVLESLFLFAETTTLPEYADLILDLDTILYNGAFSDDLCSSFGEKKLLARCDSIDAIDLLGVEQTYEVFNFQSFSKGNAELVISFDENIDDLEYRLVNVLGQEIRHQKLKKIKNLNISPEGLSGFYLLYLNNSKNAWSIPLYVFE